MCGAMDGGAQASQGCAAGAFFWRLPHQTASPQPKQAREGNHPSKTLPVILGTQFDNGIDERPGMLRIHIRGNSMPQVEDMPGAGTIARSEERRVGKECRNMAAE